MRKFPALSYSGSESDSLALFPDWMAFAGRGFMRKLFWKRFLRKWLSVYSVVLVARSRQCCVLWWTGSEKVRERPTWLWHGWPEDGFFQAHKDDTNKPSWPEPHARIHIRACLWTDCVYVMHAVGVYSVYTSRRIVGTAFRQSETRLFSMHWQKNSHSLLIILRGMPPLWLPLPSGILPWCWRWTRSMRQVSLLLLKPPPSDQQRSHVLQILEIVDSDFDILDLLLRNLGVVVEVLVSLQHSKWEPNFESISFFQLLWLKYHVSPEQVGRKKILLAL